MCKVRPSKIGIDAHQLIRSEFIPYVFQLFAALLEANASASLPQYYQSLISPVLSPELWASKGNIPALVRLLSSVIPRGAAEIAKTEQLERLLSIFSQLVSTKLNEVYGFELLECIIASIPPYAPAHSYTLYVFPD